jgi:hypothetical protein
MEAQKRLAVGRRIRLQSKSTWFLNFENTVENVAAQKTEYAYYFTYYLSHYFVILAGLSMTDLCYVQYLLSIPVRSCRR